MSQISENLKILRMMNGLTIRQVAQKVDRSPGSISNWETGKVSPDLDCVAKLCDLYEISPNELTGWEPCKAIDEFKAKQTDTLKEIDTLIAKKSELDAQIKKLMTYLAFCDQETQKYYIEAISSSNNSSTKQKDNNNDKKEP